MHKKGLMSSEEQVKKGNRSSTGLTLTACKDLSHKHPVSGLLELSTKRKWGPPQFVQIFDCGPAHKKQYIFKVVVNGQDFQPTVASVTRRKLKKMRLLRHYNNWDYYQLTQIIHYKGISESKFRK